MADQILGNLVWKITGDSTNFDKPIERSEKKFTSLTKGIVDGSISINTALKRVGASAKLTGSNVDVLKRKQALLRDEMDRLVLSGIDPADKSVQSLKTQYDKLGKEIAKATKKIVTNQEKLKKFGDSASKVGKKLTTAVTLPVIGLGVAAAKLASDVNESINAVNVVFEDASETIHDFGETASTAAGLSRTEFNELATVIGAQLKQSGQDIDTVADSTIELTQRAADLASVFNTSVKDAAGALGAALRGESEPARRFGITLSDAAVQAEALASGLVSSKKEITDQIKVQARYNLILKQSNDVAGDFANTSDGVANSTRILLAEVKDVGAELGQILLPIVKDIITELRDVVKWFGDLDDATKKTIVTIAGIAAAAGPAIGAIGGISKALSFLAANPAVLVAGAIVGITALLVKLGNDLEKLSLERQFEAAAERMEVLKEETGSAVEAITAFAEETGLSVERSIEVAEKQGLITDEVREQVDALKELNKDQENLTDNLEDEIFERNSISEYIKSSLDGIYETENAQLVLRNILQEMSEEYGVSLSKILDIAATVDLAQDSHKGIVTELQTEFKQLKENLRIYDDIAFINDANARAREQARRDRRRYDEEEKQAIIDKKAAATKAEEERLAEYEAFLERQKELLYTDEQITNLIRNETLAAEKQREDELQEYKDQKRAEEIEKERQKAQQIISISQSLYGSISSVVGAYYDFKLAQAEGDEDEQKRIAREQFEINKALQIANIGINTAAAIVGFLANPGGLLGLGLSIAAGVTGVVQAGFLLATPAPAFANGVENFRVPPGHPNDSFPIMVQSGEDVTVRTPAQQTNNGNQQVTQQFYFDRDMFFQIVNDGLVNKKIRVPQRSLV